MTDTIFALSSAAGRAGVAALRVSGPKARDALIALSGQALPAPRRATLRRFRDAAGEEIDRGLVLWFPAPGSFTGEDSAEFHSHGGHAIVEAMLAALAAMPGLRPAEAGEFTRRAVENGKLDLTRAEALADLIEAETQGQRRQALRQYEGALAERYEDWRGRLIKVSALLEAVIDFADEEIPDDSVSHARSRISTIIEEIQLHIDRSSHGEMVRDGLLLTVIGPPNAGKSSLVNALARRDVAIVSEIAGTTRDIVEVRLDLGGFLVIAADTAGLRDSIDPIEREGVRRAQARAEASDLVLLVLDGAAPRPAALPPADLIVWNKSDLPWPETRDGLHLSLRTGEGMDAVLARLTELVRLRLSRSDGSAPFTRARHRRALEDCMAALGRGVGVSGVELFAEDIRLAIRALGRLTGRVDVEEVLDVIFREFCIGK